MKLSKKIYLDTSVPSAYYDNEKPERQEQTKEFWKNLKNQEVFISELVENELGQVEDDDFKRKLLNLISKYKVLKVNKEVENLANEYMKEKIIPERFRNDALHIAVAVVNNVKFLISWNFKHLVNIKTRHMVNLVNIKKEYGNVEIIAPPELPAEGG